MIRRNPDLIALGLLTLLLALIPAAARVAAESGPPRNRIELLRERIRVNGEDVSRRVEERIEEKIREKFERLHIVR